MRIEIAADAKAMGAQAATDGAALIRAALESRGEANIIVATGTSQFETLDALTRAEGIDWGGVTGFHLDEYLGLPITHPASFRGYLKERLVDRLPLRTFHYVDGEAADAGAECARLGALIEKHPIDVAFVGIGENGHLAFNDPPADFETEAPYIVVNLDEACRRQQHGEGWFETLDAVPRQAISMSIRQILRAKHIVCTVPDERKSEAVAAALEGPVTADLPASVLQQHDAVGIYLDPPAASRLKKA